MARTHFSGPVASANGFEGSFTGNIAGNVTGNVTGNLTGNVLGNVTGNVTGNIVGNQSGGSVSATVLSASTSLAVGSGGATVKAIKSGVVSLDPGTLAAGAEIDLTASITGLAAGDVVCLMPPNAAAETGLGVILVWVSAADTLSVRCSNFNTAAALVGGAQNWTYLWYDLT